LEKIGTKIVRHGRSIIFRVAEVIVPRGLFQTILVAIAALLPLPSSSVVRGGAISGHFAARGLQRGLGGAALAGRVLARLSWEALGRMG
jgi:hypothetical protein